MAPKWAPTTIWPNNDQVQPAGSLFGPLPAAQPPVPVHKGARENKGGARVSWGAARAGMRAADYSKMFASLRAKARLQKKKRGQTNSSPSPLGRT